MLTPERELLRAHRGRSVARHARAPPRACASSRPSRQCVERGAQQPPGILAAPARSSSSLGGERRAATRPASAPSLPALRARTSPAAGPEMIERFGLDRRARAASLRKVEAVAEHLEQALLEDAQRRLERARRRAAAPSVACVVVEQLRLRIVRASSASAAARSGRRPLSRRRRGQRRGAALGALGAAERRRLAAAAPGQQQRLERLQDGGELGARAAHAAGEQRQAPVLAREAPRGCGWCRGTGDGAARSPA